jgi:tRNA pseudouridine13 synthase
LPYLTSDLPGTGGVLRTHDDDFAVDEVPAYAPRGTGDHVLIRIEKRGLTTPQAVQAIARALGVRERDVGVAGMKDRRAVTTQWLSLPPPVSPERALALALDAVRVLEAARHPHKLRTGHVRGNRFRLRIRGLAVSDPAEAEARARAILDRLARPPGAPNWYGEQRFGRAGDNAARGRALVVAAATARSGPPAGDAGSSPGAPSAALAGATPRDPRLARMLVSALQSELFNTWLTARITDGLYGTAIAGDVLHKRGGGLFDCRDPVTDSRRLEAGEVVATGPMFGERMRRPEPGTPAATREAAILDAAGLPMDGLAHVRTLAEGTRRDAAIVVDEVAVRAAPEGADDRTLEITFALPGGAYATTIMREVMKVDPHEGAAP